MHSQDQENNSILDRKKTPISNNVMAIRQIPDFPITTAEVRREHKDVFQLLI